MLTTVLGYPGNKNAIYGKEKWGDVVKEYFWGSLNYLSDFEFTKTIPSTPINVTTAFHELDAYGSYDGHYLLNDMAVMGGDIKLNNINHKGKSFLIACFYFLYEYLQLKLALLIYLWVLDFIESSTMLLLNWIGNVNTFVKTDLDVS